MKEKIEKQLDMKLTGLWLVHEGNALDEQDQNKKLCELKIRSGDIISLDRITV
jgi:hypothetical protein